MSKLDVLTIAIVIVCLAALGYLVYKIVNLVNPPDETTTSIQDSYEDPSTTDESTYSDWDDEVNTAGDDVDLDDDQLDNYADTDGNTAGSASGNYSEDEMDNETSGLAEENDLDKGSTSGSAATTPAVETPAATTNSNSGRYMVIAGSYRQRVNADNQVARLRKMGYNNAQVSLFDRGSFAVVLVDRFNNYGDAKRLVNELTGKGIEAIVDENK